MGECPVPRQVCSCALLLVTRIQRRPRPWSLVSVCCMGVADVSWTTPSLLPASTNLGLSSVLFCAHPSLLGLPGSCSWFHRWAPASRLGTAGSHEAPCKKQILHRHTHIPPESHFPGASQLTTELPWAGVWALALPWASPPSPSPP